MKAIAMVTTLISVVLVGMGIIQILFDHSYTVLLIGLVMLVVTIFKFC